jgi:competence protein ComEA
MNIFRHLIFSLFVVLLSSYGLADDTKPASPININTANIEALSDVLKGVGPSKARAIIAYRENYGGFKSVDELVEVKGIGTALVNANRDLITLK